PLLFDQVIDGTLEYVQASLGSQSNLQRQISGDLMTSLKTHRSRLADYYLRSLQSRVRQELKRPGFASSNLHPAPDTATGSRALTLELVDEQVVAADVELSHAIEAIKSVAEYELRELQTFISALVGDMDVARDYNLFRPETHANALWAAAQGLPLSRGHQVAFMRHAGTALAQQLRKSYAATSSRLEAMGIEPAAYRTMILPAGSRRGPRGVESTFNPDLHRMRETMPARIDGPLSLQAPLPAGATRPAERWRDVARHTVDPVDRQAIELVSRLFEAMQADPRVPADVTQLIARLHGPAMRLTLRDGSTLDHEKHPLWRFVNRLVYEAEMAPDPQDPDRILLLKLAQGAIEQIASEPEQNAGLYRWGLERLEGLLHKRMARRKATAATQIGMLQKLEARLDDDAGTPTTLHGMLDVPQLDTVPMELLPRTEPSAHTDAHAEDWLEGLSSGDWVRMFLQGRWVQARLLWPGERRTIWLFGDGASDATWAVSRNALLMMQAAGLAKSLRQRSIVGSAAARVQAQLANV
ncbi:MAG: DUF1631 domain-containing protein, partial [Pseudomonadota bacterium]|nr:DUF1631 domain-containing protein [Pseudomonadota bacterium]